jgi:hypothetical protein
MQVRFPAVVFASVLALVLALILGACSISEFLPSTSSEDAAGPEPAYRYIVAVNMGVIVGNPGTVGETQISALRRVESLKGAAWLVCLKAEHQAMPRFYAAFIQRNRVTDSRLSVLIDQCEVQPYAPFNWQVEGATPPPQ